MNTPEILIVDPIHPKALNRLKEQFTLHIHYEPSKSLLLRLIKDKQGIILRSGVDLDADILRSANTLKVIARAGSGIDNINCIEAKKKGIQVINVPSGSSISVAEHCMGLILSLCRNISIANDQVKKNQWKKSELMGQELFGKTIGIIGLGNIGSSLAKIAQGFSMNILGCAKNNIEKRRLTLKTQGIHLTTFEQLLTKSDIICLALPLTDMTRKMINIEEFRLMKSSAILVNVSRAEIINSKDLICALERKFIRGFATDVFKRKTEPTELAKFNNVVLTPHIGAMTDEAQLRIGQIIAENLESIFESVFVS